MAARLRTLQANLVPNHTARARGVAPVGPGLHVSSPAAKRWFGYFAV